MTKNIEDMSPEELEKYEESLDKTIKSNSIKQKQKLIEESAKKDKELLEEAQKTADDAKLAELTIQAGEQFYADHPELAPKSKLTKEGEKKTVVDKSKFQEQCEGYFDRHKTVKSFSNHSNDLVKGVPDMQMTVMRNGKWDVAGFDDMWQNTDDDSGCADLFDAWSPADNYAKVVWNTAVCKADLFKVCVKGLAINPGQGNGIQIRVYGQWGAPAALGACECATCTSITRTTYPLTLLQYGLEGRVCEFDIFDVGSILLDTQIDAMADSWATWFDNMIYQELFTATPGTDVTLTAALSCTPTQNATCCDDVSLMYLYDAVNRASAAAREGANPYNLDYMIISPTIANIFKRMNHASPVLLPGDVHFDSDGNLSKIAGINVIEYCRAQTCTSLTGTTIAILVDSRRAVGAVFGEQPKMYKRFVQECNSWHIDWWCFAAFGELDTAAIYHIVNP